MNDENIGLRSTKEDNCQPERPIHQSKSLVICIVNTSKHYRFLLNYRIAFLFAVVDLLLCDFLFFSSVFPLLLHIYGVWEVKTGILII